MILSRGKLTASLAGAAILGGGIVAAGLLLVQGDTEPAATVSPTPSVSPLPTPTSVPSPASGGDTEPPTDTEQIREAGRTHALASVGCDAVTGFTITSVEDGFARTGVECNNEPTGFAQILKQAGDGWTVVFQGNGTPDQATIELYGIPGY
ncbi:MAG: hypothetical protein WD603_00525 [Patescibacteria group bacterium]